MAEPWFCPVGTNWTLDDQLRTLKVKESMSHICMVGMAKVKPSLTTKITPQAQMYVMEHSHEVDEHALILTQLGRRL